MSVDDAFINLHHFMDDFHHHLDNNPFTAWTESGHGGGE